MASPLSDLEMYDLIRAAYPKKFPNDDNQTWKDVEDFVDEMEGWEDLCRLLGRVVMLTAPMSSPLTGEMFHALGSVTISDGKAVIVAAVKRPVKGSQE